MPVARLPGAVERAVADLISELEGRRPPSLRVEAVGGGCIHHAVRVDADRGPPLFVKWNDREPHDVFAKEADGLRALARVGAVRVPRVLGHSSDGDPGPAWLALEYLPPQRPRPTYASELGGGLAALHAAPCRDGFGWETHNYVGSLYQDNSPAAEWSAFWRDRRILPQVRLASERLAASDHAELSRLLDRLADLLRPGQDEGPALVHGDLWSGNAFAGPDGRPVLVDPAVYRGHREVDLAMMELFGGFADGVFRAYRDAAPLVDGYAEVRRSVYQLYPLLVHLNLFGTGYRAGVRAAVARALSSG